VDEGFSIKTLREMRENVRSFRKNELKSLIFTFKSRNVRARVLKAVELHSVETVQTADVPVWTQPTESKFQLSRAPVLTPFRASLDPTPKNSIF
jgi:hypothetical protein